MPSVHPPHPLDRTERALQSLGVSARKALTFAEREPRFCCIEVGVVLEGLLRGVWEHLEVDGSPDQRALDDLFRVTTSALAKAGQPVPRRVQDYVRAIQMARNRAAHFSRESSISQHDAAAALDQLAVVAAWYLEEVLGLEPDDESQSAQGAPPPGPVPVAPPPGPMWKMQAALASLLLVAAASWLGSTRPSFDAVQLVEGIAPKAATTEQLAAADPCNPVGHTFSLILNGENLDGWGQLWAGPWIEVVEAAGLVPVDRRATVRADGRRACFTVRPDDGFDAKRLPAPGPLAVQSEQTLPLSYLFTLRVVNVAYKRGEQDRREGARGSCDRGVPEKAKPAGPSKMDRMERMYSMILGLAAEPGVAGDARVRFRPELDFDERNTASFEASELSGTADELLQSDILHTSAYIWVLLDSYYESTGQNAQEPVLQWQSCNQGHKTRSPETYSSILFAVPGSAAAQAVDHLDEHERPAAFLAWLRSLENPDDLEVVYGSPASTSGTLYPCMAWHQVFEEVGVRPVHSKNHEATTHAVFCPNDAYQRLPLGRIGAGYKRVIDSEMAREGWGADRDRVILWEDDAIPHGGAVLNSTILPAKRRAVEDLFDTLNERINLGKFPSSGEEWPEMGDTKGMRACNLKLFEDLKRRVLESPSREACAQLATGPK